MSKWWQHFHWTISKFLPYNRFLWKKYHVWNLAHWYWFHLLICIMTSLLQYYEFNLVMFFFCVALTWCYIFFTGNAKTYVKILLEPCRNESLSASSARKTNATSLITYSSILSSPNTWSIQIHTYSTCAFADTDSNIHPPPPPHQQVCGRLRLCLHLQARSARICDPLWTGPTPKNLIV